MGEVWDSVRAAWTPFNNDLEGVVTWMYLDTKGLVTTGMGNLIDSVAGDADAGIRAAQRRTWTVEGEDRVATDDEVAAEWRSVKSMTDRAALGGGRFSAWTRLRLAPASLDEIVADALDGAEAGLVARPSFAALAEWPADAQLGILSMAWAMGAAGVAKFGRFSAAVAERDFGTAATESHMRDDAGGTLRTRNERNALAFRNAAEVERDGSDPGTLHWPAEYLADALEPRGDEDPRVPVEEPTP